MSPPDRDAESSYANLVREITGLPLVGMTLAGRDLSWSARHWDLGVGRDIRPSDSENVRVIGDQLPVWWNDELIPPPPVRDSHVRTMTCWGPRMHADLTRRSVLVLGLGSVGLDVAVRLGACPPITGQLLVVPPTDAALATESWLHLDGFQPQVFTALG
jgi:hypothetical protein